MYTLPYFEQPDEIAVEAPNVPNLVPTDEGEEYVVEAILKHHKKGKGFQLLTLMKGDSTHDAEWQPARNFVDQNGAMNEVFYEIIKMNRILEHLWNNEGKDLAGTATGE